MRRIILILIVLILIFLAPLSAWAGDLAPPAPPTDPAGQMISLQALNDYLLTGTLPPSPSAFQGPSGPPAGTMVSLQHVYEAVKALMDQSDVTAADVRAGKKYFSATSGNWGIQDGTLPDRALSDASADVPAGYYDATTLDAVDADLTGESIIEGVTIFGITGKRKVLDNCGAWVASGVWKRFDCYNLGAFGKLTLDNPFSPSWRLNGGYWQWGRKGPGPNDWYDTNTEHFAHGPTGPDADEANDAPVSGWNSSDYPSGNAWSNGQKTANDPCPDGYRLPSESQWWGVRSTSRNPVTDVGTWDDDPTNYSRARFFGNHLMLPAAGLRYEGDGSLDYRGSSGSYWAGGKSGGFMYNISFTQYDTSGSGRNHLRAYSVRCIAE